MLSGARERSRSPFVSLDIVSSRPFVELLPAHAGQLGNRVKTGEIKLDEAGSFLTGPVCVPWHHTPSLPEDDITHVTVCFATYVPVCTDAAVDARRFQLTRLQEPLLSCALVELQFKVEVKPPVVTASTCSEDG